MSLKEKLFFPEIIALSFLFAVIVYTGRATAQDGKNNDDASYQAIPGMRLAKGKKGGDSSVGRGGKMLMKEKTIKTKKGQAKQSLDFEETSIGGERKTPLGSFISQTKSDKNFDFVKIRTNWHPEMIQSATMLEGQRN